MSAIVRITALIGVIVCLMPGLAGAQAVQGGVEGGVAWTSLSNLRDAIDFGGPVDVQSRAGFVAGAFVRFPLNPRIALQPEVLYATKGATPTDGTNELEIKLGYVDIPILVQYSPSPGKPLYLLFGPSVNFNVSAKTVDAIPAGAEEDISGDVSNAELGLVVGAGLGVARFLIEGRYSAGLTDIASSPTITETVRNRGFAVIAGIRF